MIEANGISRAVQLNAVAPESESRVSSLPNMIRVGDMQALVPRGYGIVLGEILARQLGVYLGDKVRLTLPKVNVTPVGLLPRQRQFTVVGIFSAGTQLDGTAIYIHLHDGQRLFQQRGKVQGFRVRVDDMFAVTAITRGMPLPDNVRVLDWSESQGSLFAAVTMEKRMIRVLLFLVVIIAAFNIVAVLAMMVAEKRPAIAVLRTMGASPQMISHIFVLQGLFAGLTGVIAGCTIGLPLALYIGDVVNWLEQLAGGSVFDPQIYFISNLPSLFRWQDLAWVCGGSLLIAFVAALYPARRAADVQPVEALHYDK